MNDAEIYNQRISSLVYWTQIMTVITYSFCIIRSSPIFSINSTNSIQKKRFYNAGILKDRIHKSNWTARRSKFWWQQKTKWRCKQCTTFWWLILCGGSLILHVWILKRYNQQGERHCDKRCWSKRGLIAIWREKWSKSNSGDANFEIGPTGNYLRKINKLLRTEF